MKTPQQTENNRKALEKGVTLIELTVVLFVIMGMISATMYFGGNIAQWRKAKEASESLRSVYAAQRAFLADNPRRTLESLLNTELVVYLPDQTGVIPSVESLAGDPLVIDITVSPPVLRSVDASIYDPSGRDNDSLWDVGS